MKRDVIVDDLQTKDNLSQRKPNQFTVYEIFAPVTFVALVGRKCGMCYNIQQLLFLRAVK